MEHGGDTLDIPSRSVGPTRVANQGGKALCVLPDGIRYAKNVPDVRPPRLIYLAGVGSLSEFNSGLEGNARPAYPTLSSPATDAAQCSGPCH